MRSLPLSKQRRRRSDQRIARRQGSTANKRSLYVPRSPSSLPVTLLPFNIHDILPAG